jgi:hypothetical protein
MRQPFIPPLEEEDDLVVPEGWAEIAKEHWRMFLPKRYARLKAEGKLDQEAQEAAYYTASDMSELMGDGFSEREAWQAFREEWIFLPSEDEQPDPWSLNLDPDPIIQALTRLCGHYYDEGADYATWAEAVREDTAEEFTPYLEKAWEAVTGKPPENPKRTMSWNRIRNAARAVFNVWADQPEMKWARKAWFHLRTKGLTSYRTDVERTMVLVRLGTLALMYREFCEIAFGESQGDFEWVQWDQLGIESSSLPQLVHPETDSNEADGRGAEDREEGEIDDGDADGDLDINDALQELSQRVRPEIYEALVDGFGDDSMLFASLWRTVSHESLEDTVNEVTPEKGEAFSWICQGMDQLH